MCSHSQDNLPIRPEPLPISCLKHPAKKHSSSSLPCCLSARACSLHWRPQDAQASACTMQERSGRQDFASGDQPRTKKQKAAATAAHWNVPLPTPKIASGARAAATVAHWNVHLQQRVAHQSPACKHVGCGQFSSNHAAAEIRDSSPETGVAAQKTGIAKSVRQPSPPRGRRNKAVQVCESIQSEQQ